MSHVQTKFLILAGVIVMQQTYEEFINNILEIRGRFNIPDNEYYERHHIIPRCMSGTDNVDNLIDLYAREHFIAHKLLALESPQNKKLVYAWWCMSNGLKTETQEHYELTPEEYEEARIALSEAKTGIPLSEETRKKISEAKMGEKNANYGKTCPEDIKKKISIANKGKHYISEEEKERLRQIHKGGNSPKARSVIRLRDNKIYSCAKNAAEENNINYKTFTRHCRQHKDFMYYDDWIAVRKTHGSIL